MDDRVQIWHPDVPGTRTNPSSVTRRAAAAWATVGWLPWPPKKTAARKPTPKKETKK